MMVCDCLLGFIMFIINLALLLVVQKINRLPLIVYGVWQLLLANTYHWGL